MLITNNNPVEQINTVEETCKKETISKTDGQVSKLAKVFFKSIGVCIVTPFKFCAKILKSGFIALISLLQKESKKNPALEKQVKTGSAGVAETHKKLEDIKVKSETKLENPRVKSETEDANLPAKAKAEEQEQTVEDLPQINEEVENSHVENSFSFAGLAAKCLLASAAGFAGTLFTGLVLIPEIKNMFRAPYQGDIFEKISMPQHYPNESIVFGK